MLRSESAGLSSAAMERERERERERESSDTQLIIENEWAILISRQSL